MEKQSVIHSTFVIERRYPATAEQVFSAFADSKKKRHWFVEGEHHEVQHYEIDFSRGRQGNSSYEIQRRPAGKWNGLHQ